jgi:hypothetical protein
LTNPYCEALGIRVPALNTVRDHPEANVYTLMIVALLERGHPMTLLEIAERFAHSHQDFIGLSRLATPGLAPAPIAGETGKSRRAAVLRCARGDPG